jgi:ABC-type antimicrobial peptide transport system permease subunit
MKLHDLTEGSRSVGAYYFSTDQAPASFLTFAVKAGGADGAGGDALAQTSALRGVVQGLDRELPVFDTRSMEQRMQTSLVARRSPAVLSLVFGGVALFLSALGIYGVLAYVVTQRRREIGIRIALGSSVAAIFELVLREGLVLIGGGLTLGAVGVFLLRTSLQTQLFGVAATDPVVLVTVTGLLALVAILACVLPAAGATRIDPVVALAE